MPFRSRPSTYPYAEAPLYSQTPTAGYYEAGAAAQVSTSAASQAVASSASVPMYVSGGQVVGSAASSGAGTSSNGGSGSGAGASSAGTGGGGGASGGNGASSGSSGSGTGGTYVIQGGYMLGSASQSYSHTTRASPATVSARVEWGGHGVECGGPARVALPRCCAA